MDSFVTYPRLDDDHFDVELFTRILPCENSRIGLLLADLLTMGSRKKMLFRYCDIHNAIEVLSCSNDTEYKLHKYLYSLNLGKLLTRMKLGWIQISENSWHRSEVSGAELYFWKFLFETLTCKMSIGGNLSGNLVITKQNLHLC